jgi:DNA-binding GntR family transcriptional regulator
VERVSESLLQELTGGVPVPGAELADAAELAERLGVRASTVRAAIHALLDAGYLERANGGSGIHVSPVAAYAVC